MAEHVARNLRLRTMRPDGEAAISSNPNYNNFNSNLRLNGLFVCIDFIDLELDTDRWDAPRAILSYLDLIDLTTGTETAYLNNDFFSQAEIASPIVMSPDLIDLWLDTESVAYFSKLAVVSMNLIELSDIRIIPVIIGLVDFTMRTGVIRHADSDSSGLSTTSGSINAFDLDPEDDTMGSLPSGTDEWSPAFAAELVAILDALIKLLEEQLQ
ncbi:hypothetical protein N7447_007000 [Penicillium robsamsonii]|uniref:uncharacterized protein n=1 Tax=Penicillium robsamsonii TaxID=1792511 RepID=UPI0025465995|nr:uncharacterized protein N7447_007000 [Penicillium robsamsonii]KAJ5824660.1 hypothetical protein N7447_007000 [Penicillium robsamsonii]